jgi:hypothetical protein
MRRERFTFNRGRTTPGGQRHCGPPFGPHERLVAVIAIKGRDERINLKVDDSTFRRLRAATVAFLSGQSRVVIREECFSR